MAAPTLYDIYGQAKGASDFFNKRGTQMFDSMNKGLDWVTGENGDPTKGALYNSYLTKSREATTNYYDRAVSNMRTSAAGRGFGYASPNSQGGELALRGQQAGQLSGAPASALQSTMPTVMEAQGLREREGESERRAGVSEEGLAADAISQKEKLKAQSKSGLFKGLAGLAGTILGGPLGGALGSKLGGLFGGGDDPSSGGGGGG